MNTRLLLRFLTTLCCFWSAFLSAELSAQTLTVSGADFDTTSCGTKKCHKIYFRNDNATTQTLESIAALGTVFTLEDANYTPPYQIKTGDSVGILFCYTANSPGVTDQEDITLQLTGVATQQKVTLRGKTVAPRMAVSSATVDFGTIILGTAKTINIVVTNQGDGTLTIPNASGMIPPFFIIRGTGLVLKPGESDTISFLYVPTVEGSQTATAVFGSTPCLAAVNILLKGTAIKAPLPSLGGVLQINPKVVDFDSALCAQRKSMSIEFRNIGSDNIMIRSVVDAPRAPFGGTIPLGTIAANAGQSFTLTYEPTSVPEVDSQIVRFRADTRQSLDIGMLFDVSGSMTTRISPADATQRLRAAKDAGKIFVSQLITDTQRNVIDQAQVMSFSSPASTFTIQSPFTTDRNATRTAIDNLVAGGGTCLYESLIRAVQAIKDKPHPVLVLLSDGGDGGCDVTRALSDALAAITASNIKVFVVGITDPADPLANTLKQIAAAGSGTASFARTQEELTNAFIQISQQLSQDILIEFLLRGHSVAPLLNVTPSVLHFDSVRVGQTRCLTFNVTNTGTAPQAFSPAMFSGLDPQFSVRNIPVATLLPNAPAASFELCFTPIALRQQATPLNIDYSTCRQRIVVNADGIGYDSLIIVLDSVITNARIGDTVRMPLRMRSLAPRIYAIDSFFITLSYNSTVLDAQGCTQANTLTSVFTPASFNSTYTGLSGQTQYRFRGGTLVNTLAESRMALFNFNVLRGNAMSSDVRVLSAQFADGNPKVGIVQPGRVDLDPVCYLAKRLVDPSKRIGQGVTLLSLGSEASGSIHVRYSITERSDVRISVYDMLGRELHSQSMSDPGVGEHDLQLFSAHPYSGMCVVRIDAQDASDSMLLQIP